MSENPLDAIEPAPRDVLRQLLDFSLDEPPYSAVWPSAANVGHRSLSTTIPKAVNAWRLTLHERRMAAYMAQEKLNGVWVLWDGTQMWSKSGIRIDVPDPFRVLLPPSFALICELFLGYGHNAFQYAKELGTNRLPQAINLPTGTLQEAARPQIWQNVRLVAFDAPGLGDGVAYAQRYVVMQLVVGAWSARKHRALDMPAMLPLQLIRQYPIALTERLFCEVVEGRKWQERTLPGFGIPQGVMVGPAVPIASYNRERAFTAISLEGARGMGCRPCRHAVRDPGRKGQRRGAHALGPGLFWMPHPGKRAVAGTKAVYEKLGGVLGAAPPPSSSTNPACSPPGRSWNHPITRIIATPRTTTTTTRRISPGTASPCAGGTHSPSDGRNLNPSSLRHWMRVAYFCSFPPTSAYSSRL